MTSYKELFEWNNSDPLTEIERNYVTKHFHPKYNIDDWNNDVNKYCSDRQWGALTNTYIKLLPGCNITTDTYRFRVDASCSALIEALFNYYVDKDTLVISSDCEHPTVKKCLENCKNTLILSHSKDIHMFNFNKVKTVIKSYKKIFIYLIAVRNDTGEIIPQSFFTQLKILLKDKESILVLDDVQGMFFVNRDYSLFDYILGTAHVAVRTYDTGFMFSKISNPDIFGHKFYSWAKNYLYPLQVVLKRIPKLYKFRDVFNRCFENKIPNFSNIISKSMAIPYLFYLNLNYAKVPPEISLDIEKTNVLIMPDTSFMGGIRLRALGFIIQPEVFSAAIAILLYTIKHIKLSSKALLKLKNTSIKLLSTNPSIINIERQKLNIIDTLYPLLVTGIIKINALTKNNILYCSYSNIHFSQKQIEKLSKFGIKIDNEHDSILIGYETNAVLEGITLLVHIIESQLITVF